MDKKAQFNEALVSLVEYAAANANHVTKQDITLHFKDIISDESMYGAIYTYLKESKITVDDADSNISNENSNSLDNPNTISENTATLSKTLESEEELAFIKLYMDDLNTIAPLNAAEREELISKLPQKDAVAMARLTEDCLKVVAEIAQNYRNQGVTYGDLIQEGNIGLMSALAEFNSTVGEFDNFISAGITDAITDAINLQVNSDRIGNHLADRINNLDDISRELTEELGQAPSLSELANALSLSEEEVTTIIQTSMNALSLSGEESETDVQNNE